MKLINFNLIKCQMPIRREAGFGLVEIIISAALVSLLALGLAFYTTSLKATVGSQSNANFDCMNHSASFLDNLIARGGPVFIPPYTNTFHPFDHPYSATPPTAGAMGRPSNVEANLDDFLNDNLVTQVWPTFPAQVFQQTTAPSVISANALLITDRMRLLGLLYNNASPDFCSDFQTNAGLTALANATNANIGLSDNQTPTTTAIRISAYDLATGAVRPCGDRPLWIYPRNRATTTTTAKADAFQAGYFASPGANYLNNRGYLVEVQTTYKADEQGTLRTCNYSQRFAYPTDETPPPRPVVSMNITYGSGLVSAHQNAVTLTIRGAAVDADFERGTVFMCRDRSTLWRANTTTQCYIHQPTWGAASGPGPQAMTGYTYLLPLPRGRLRSSGLANDADPGPSPLISPASTQTSPARPAGWGTDQWVRCEQLRVCGRPPSASPIVTVSNGNPQLVLNYSSVRSECLLRVEVAAMDTAANLHLDGTATPTFNPAKLLSSSITTPVPSPGTGTEQYAGLVTPRPLCGTWCPPTANWPAGATGYYVANGSCCVGAGCVRGASIISGVRQLGTLSTDPAP